VKLSVEPSSAAPVGVPGGVASRWASPEFALSWWKRGHDAGEHAPAAVS
jgi:hypothetical protein